MRKVLFAALAAVVVAVGLTCAFVLPGQSPNRTTKESTHGQTVYVWGLHAHKIPEPVTGLPTGQSVVQLVATNSDTFMLLSSGDVYVVGENKYGEFGNGTRGDVSDFSAVKVDLPSGVIVKALANPMPNSTGMAITTTGSVYGWGYNEYGELCLGNTDVELTPKLLPLTDITESTGAGGHALYYDSSKETLYACGRGGQGELGDGSFTNFSTPQIVSLPKGEQVESLTSAWGDSGALMDGGSFYNWGFNAHDELGNNSEQPADVPVQVPGTFTEVSEGGSEANNGQTLAITTAGKVQGWGDDRWGQLCDGKTSVRPTPSSINLGAIQVSSAGFSSYYVEKNGDLYGCGLNDEGQLGNSSPILTKVSVVSGTAANVAAIVGTGTIGS